MLLKRGVKSRNMSKLDPWLEDGLRSELVLQQQLKALSDALRQQLQETEKRQREDLEIRIHQNALLSADQDSNVKTDIEHQAGHVEVRSSTFTSDHTPQTLHHHRQPEKSTFQSPSNQKHCSVGTTRTPTRTQHCERLGTSKTTQMRKDEEAQAECQKKFCALPVPSHVVHPLYQEMVELREKKRKQGLEQRREFLLSIQKPFSFQEREKEKRTKLITVLNQVSHDHQSKVTTVREPPHKEVKDLSDSDLKEAKQENSTVSASPKLRTAERNRKEKLGFLYERPSFQPQIIHQVPDFSRLHKELQKDALRKTQRKEEIKCQPFCLRTSVLAARRSGMSPENTEVPKTGNLIRTKSLGALTSMSTDTLPVYITDAVRKRCMAIRKAMEIRDSKNQESADWMRMHQMRSQAMKKTVTLHAKLLDPHSSLKEVHTEKLQHHRAADQQRMREYMRELREMKARVSQRPFLFEQVKQKNAKAHAEQTYRNKLKTAGIKEQFVEENGETSDGTATSFRSEEHTDENDIHSREELVDDWEKIEDVKEKSVKSKGEEMP